MDKLAKAERRQLAGPAAIEAALAAGLPLQLVLAREGALSPASEELLHRLEAEASAASPSSRIPIPIRRAGVREFDRLCQSSKDEELLAMVGPSPAIDLNELFTRRGAVWLLTGTAYPGNAGFVIRTAEVSGASGVVLDCDFDRSQRRDCFRAALRADRLFPVLFESALATIETARNAGYRAVAIEDVGDRAPWQIDLTGRVLFTVGGEKSGIPADVLEACDATVRIPMQGFIPAYNLQAAMAAVASERLRQLSAPSAP